MERQISAFLERVSGFYFPEIRLTDVLEVLILTFLIYQLIIWIKNTKAWMLLKGILVLAVFIFVCGDLPDEYDPLSGQERSHSDRYRGGRSVPAGAAQRLGETGRETFFKFSSPFGSGEGVYSFQRRDGGKYH